MQSYPMTEEKAHANKYIQVSLDKEENILEKFKSLQKENQQLKGTLKEKDSTISRLMKITKDQHAELLFEMKKQNEVDVRNREEKIAKLKQYISDTFQEKSREHQQQMDELRRELNRSAEKMHILKTKLGKEIRSKKV